MPKLDNKNKKSKRNNTLKRFIYFISILFIVIFLLAFVFNCFDGNTESAISTNTETIQTNKITIFTTNYLPYLDYVKLFETSIQYLYTETNHDPIDYTCEDVLKDTSKLISIRIYTQLRFIRVKTLTTLDIIPDFSKHNKAYNYYRILFKFFNILNDIYLLFKEYDKLEENRYYFLNRQEIDRLKFVVQDLILIPLVTLLNEILSCFNNTIKELKFRTNFNKEIKITAYNLFNVFKEIKDNILMKYNDNIKLKDDLYIMNLEYIITDIQKVKELFIVSVYIIYLHLFELGEEFEVSRLDITTEKAINEIKNVWNWDIDETLLIHICNSIVLNCMYVMIPLRNLNKEKLELFYRSFNEINKNCIYSINNLVTVL